MTPLRSAGARTVEARSLLQRVGGAEQRRLAQRRAVSWSPIGSPAPSRPHGTLIAGTPARFAGIVKMSDRYMASGSSVFSPIRNAVVGDVGETSTSKRSNARS